VVEAKLDVREEKKKEEKKEGKLQALAKQIRNKLTVLYGEPFVGKTTLAHLLSKYFEHTVIFKIDKNYRPEDFRHINSNIHYVNINSHKGLISVLDDMLRNPPQNALIVVDSITGLDAFFMPSDPSKPSPRMENARARFVDAVMQRLSFIKYNGNTVIVIAHERLRNWETQERVPRFNVTALRHADMCFRLVKENEHRRLVRTHLRDYYKAREEDFLS